MSELVFLKLGGSLITDKTRPYTCQVERLRRLATEIRAALEQRPDLRLVLGHGSGSFGHQAAAAHDTRRGVHTAEQWRGYAGVAAAAARLNQMVLDALWEAGVPALAVRPSSSARCHDGRLVHMDIEPIRRGLEHGLPPLLHGDVALDAVRGGTIVSTEDLFVYLAGPLSPQRILLAGEVEGVLDRQGGVVARVTPATFPAVRPLLSGSHGVDVTGGMADKVVRMVGLVEERPGLVVRVFSGLEAGCLQRALVEPEWAVGTQIVA